MTVCPSQVDLPPQLEHFEEPCITYVVRLLGDEVAKVGLVTSNLYKDLSVYVEILLSLFPLIVDY